MDYETRQDIKHLLLMIIGVPLAAGVIVALIIMLFVYAEWTMSEASLWGLCGFILTFVIMVPIMIGLFYGMRDFIDFIKLGIEEHKETKVAIKAAGTCKHCGKELCAKKLPNGDFACRSCYKKMAPKQLAEQKSEIEAEKQRHIEAYPIKIETEFGHYDSYNALIKNHSDSAGGWDIKLKITNRSSKTVKYIYTELIPYNTVGDVEYGSTYKKGIREIKVTGPIKGEETKFINFEHCWYDIRLGSVGVGTIKVIFMDGTEKTFEQE